MRIKEELMEKMEEKFKEGLKEYIENYNSNLYYHFYVDLDENDEIEYFWWEASISEYERYNTKYTQEIYSISGYHISCWYDDTLLNLKDWMMNENFLNCNDNEFDDNLDEVFEKFKKENEIDLTKVLMDNLLENNVFDYEFEEACEDIKII